MCSLHSNPESRASAVPVVTVTGSLPCVQHNVQSPSRRLSTAAVLQPFWQLLLCAHGISPVFNILKFTDLTVQL